MVMFFFKCVIHFNCFVCQQVDVTSTPVGHTGDNERTLCHSNEEHAIVAEGEERGDSGEGAYYSNIIPTSGSTAPQSGRSGSFSHDDGSGKLPTLVNNL